MKKIVLLMFGLLFAGIFSVASANGVVMDKIGIECKSSIDGGDLFTPSELIMGKSTVKEAENPMYSKWGEEDKLNIDGFVSLNEHGSSIFDIVGKKNEVGWQGETDG